nr:hypothetical protein [Tanacetum cinerariifolium]
MKDPVIDDGLSLLERNFNHISLEENVSGRGEHRSKTGPDRDRVGPKLRTEDRTEMVPSGPGRSSVGSGPTRHIFGFLVRSDRTEDRIGTKPRTEDQTEIRSVLSGQVATETQRFLDPFQLPKILLAPTLSLYSTFPGFCLLDLQPLRNEEDN